MKKSLSLLLAIAMVFSMFAAMASAAEEKMTVEQKFDVLMEAGIFEGYPPNNDPGLNREMTRAEFAKILALVTDAPSSTTATYTDVPATHWAAEYIGAVSAAGLMNGIGHNKFDPNAKVSVEMVAITVARALGLDETTGNLTGTYSPWAEGFIIAVQQAGLPIVGPNYKANALRTVLVENAYTLWVLGSVEVSKVEVVDADNIKVTFKSGEQEEVVEQKLDTALVPNQATNVTVHYKGVDFVVSATLTQAQVEAKVAGAKKFEVKFNKAITETATFTVTLGSQNIPVATTWDADKKVATLTTSSNNNLVAGTYTVKVAGISDLSQDTFELVVTAETLTSARLANTTVKPNDAAAQVRVEGLNQYGEVMSTVQGTNFNWTVFNKTLSVNVDKTPTAAGFTIATNNTTFIRTGDQLVVTGVNTSNASVIASGTLVVSDAAMSELTFGDIVLPASDTSLKEKTAAVFYELPYTLKDGAGNTVTFDNATEAAPGAFAVNGVNFTTDKADVITGLKVENGKLYVKIAANKSGNVKVIATLSAVSKVVVKDLAIAGVSTTDSVVLGAQPQTLTAGASVNIPVTVYDQYGVVIPASTFANNRGQFSLGSSNNSVATASFTTDGKSLNVAGHSKGTATITITNNNSSKLITFVANVQDAAIPTAFTTKVTANTVVKDQASTLKAAVTDQYGGTMAATALTGYRFEISTSAVSNVSVNATTRTPAEMIGDDAAGVTLTGLTAGQSANIVVKLVQNGTNNVVQEKTITINVADSNAAFTYRFKEDLTVYAAVRAAGTFAAAQTEDAFGSNSKGDAFKKKFVIEAVDASGNGVAYPAEYVSNIRAVNNADAVIIGGDKEVIGKRWLDSATEKVVDVEATVRNQDGTFQQVQGKVIVKAATPTVSAVKAYKGTAEVAEGATTGTTNLTVSQVNSLDGAILGVTADIAQANRPALYFVVTDQYGVNSLTPAGFSASFLGDVEGSINTATGEITIDNVPTAPTANDKIIIVASAGGINKTITVNVVAN